MSDVEALRRNAEAYRQMLANELLPNSEGKYVVFADARHVDTFESHADALKFAYGTYGREPFFVHKVAPLEEEGVASHFACRL